MSTTVQTRGPVDTKILREIFEQLCQAVGAAHRAGIVHRDLKPENVFLARSRIVGIHFVVKVLDFGIAKIVAEARAHTTEPMGTPLWMAPEQTARGSSVSPQTDVWALGLIGFFCLTGHTYWASAEEEHPSVERILREMLVDDLIPPSERARQLGLALPRWFDGWFDQCVRREPTARFPDATKAWDQLRRCIDGEPASCVTEPMLFNPVHGGVIGVPPTIQWDGVGNNIRLPEPTVDANRLSPLLDNARVPPRAEQAAALAQASSRARVTPKAATWVAVGVALVAVGLGIRAAVISFHPECPVGANWSKEENHCVAMPVMCAAGTEFKAGAGCVPGTSESCGAGYRFVSGQGCIATAVPAPSIPARPSPGSSAPSGRGPKEVPIPGGGFQMGSNDGATNEKPVHMVKVPSFYMDETEVTVEQYRECVNAGECSAPTVDDGGGIGVAFLNWGKSGRDRHPVNGVSWESATAFCAWAGKRLPTEEEWEYAARGTDGREYPWGNDAPSAAHLNVCDSSCATYFRREFSKDLTPMFSSDDGWATTAPVGSYGSGTSPFGLYDMAGNVLEWTCAFGTRA